MGRHETSGPFYRITVVLICLVSLFFLVSCDADNLQNSSNSAQRLGSINLGYAGSAFPDNAIDCIDDILSDSKSFYLEIDDFFSLNPSITYNSMQLDRLRSGLVSLADFISKLAFFPGEDSEVRTYLDSETTVPNNYFSIPFIYHLPVALPSVTARYLDNILLKNWEKMKERSSDGTTLVDQIVGENDDGSPHAEDTLESIAQLFEHSVHDTLRGRDRLTVGDAVFSAIFLDFVLSFDHVVDFYGEKINSINLSNLIDNEDFNRVLSYVKIMDYIYKTDFEYRLIKIGLMSVLE